LQRGGDRLGKLHRNRSRLHPSLHAHEQHIAICLAQLRQAITDRRLRKTKTHAGGGQVAGSERGVK
jgi:hypothetical protein